MAFDEKSNNNYTALGEGSYGFVFYPALPNYNNQGMPLRHVSKLFFEEDDYRHLMNKTNTLSTIFPAYQLPQPYRRSYTVKNIPQKFRRYLNHTYTNESTVHMVRIPYLGRSLEELVGMDQKNHTLSPVRRCAIWKILREITKLLSYTNEMTKKGYLHGDISPGNIVFDEKECRMYLIDFDWFYPYSDYYANRGQVFGKATDPPETLFIPAFRYLPRIFVPTRLYEKAGTRKNPYKAFEQTQKNEVRGNIQYADKIQREFSHIGAYLSRNKIHSAIQSSMKKNAEYLTRSITSNTTATSLFSIIAPYFDNYGLGFCLTELLLALYPLPMEGDEESFIDFLRDSAQPLPSRVNHYDHYAKSTVYTIRQTIRLLMSLSSFVIEKRPSPPQAYESMERIYHDYLAELHTMGIATDSLSNSNQYRRKRRNQNTRKNRS